MTHGEPAEAETLLHAAVRSIGQQRGQDTPEALNARGDLAYAMDAQGHNERAVPVYLQAIADATRAYGTDDPLTLELENNLAFDYNELGNTAEAEKLLRKVYEGSRKYYGDEHGQTLNALNSLAVLMGRNGDFAGAEPLQRRAYTKALQALGPDHTYTLNAQMDLARVDLELGKLAESRTLLSDVIERWKKHDNAMALIRCRRWLGRVLRALGKRQQAEQVLLDSWQVAKAIGSRSQQAKSARVLADLYGDSANGRSKEAAWLKRAQALEKPSNPPPEK